MATASSASIARRHDLDALRAVAMLLGIVLHGAMSFIPGVGAFWGVQDPASSEAFGVVLAGIHEFRIRIEPSRLRLARFIWPDGLVSPVVFR